MANYDKHREMLLDKQGELNRRLEALERDASTPLNKDSEEQATELENRDVVIALGDEARAELAEITRALDRLEKGLYGTCARCGEPVAPARLEAYPAAIHCISCA